MKRNVRILALMEIPDTGNRACDTEIVGMPGTTHPASYGGERHDGIRSGHGVAALILSRRCKTCPVSGQANPVINWRSPSAAPAKIAASVTGALRDSTEKADMP